MRKMYLFSSLLFVCLLVMLAVFSAEAQDGPPQNYRQLRDLPVLVGERHGMWIGAGNGLAVQWEDVCNNPYIPVNDEYNGLPAYHILVTGEADGGWWNAILAGKDWESYSVQPYYPNGALEFNIRGAFGGEDMKIGVQDVEFERQDKHISGAEVNVSDYVAVATEWQSVSIPILDLIPNGGILNLDQLHGITLAAVNSSATELWINNVRWTSPAVEPSSPAVKVNQLGYTTNGEKYAYVSGFEEEMTARQDTPFEVREIGNNTPVYSGKLQLVSTYDAGASGEYVLLADFSEVTTPGDYYVSVAAYKVDDSPAFAIGDGIYGELLVDASRYFFLQRQGMALDAAHAGIFERGVGHQQDQQVLFRSGGEETVDVSQGWYDAGDYGKYVNAGAITLSDLFWAYELFPEQFADSQFNIPEGGNGLPDLLDEAQWELAFIRKMQEPASGGFYHMVQPSADATPDQAADPRYIEDVRLISAPSERDDAIKSIIGCGEDEVADTRVTPSATSATAVAALAHGSIVYAELAPAYAQELLDSAEFGWQFLTSNPDGVLAVDGPYKDDDDADDRFWAAAALFRATGNEVYHDFIRATYADIRTDFLAEDENAYGMDKTGMIGVWHYFSAENTDPEIYNFFAEQFNSWRQQMVERNRSSVWKTTLLDEDYYWGSNYVALTAPLALAVGTKALGNYDSDITEMAQTALNYLLGVNPLRLSYVSGYGEDSVQNLHSAIWNFDGRPDIPRGVLAGGPNAYTDPMLYSNFPAKRYIDNPATWTVNEHTIYWNAALVFNAALIANEVNVAPALEPTPQPTEAALALPTTAVEDSTTANDTPPPAPEPTLFPVEAPPVTQSAPAMRTLVAVAAVAAVTTALLFSLAWAFFLRR